MSNTKKVYPDRLVRLERARPSEENFVIVSINGRNWQIMKGVDVRVPYEVYAILRERRAEIIKAEAFLDERSKPIK